HRNAEGIARNRKLVVRLRVFVLQDILELRQANHVLLESLEKGLLHELGDARVLLTEIAAETNEVVARAARFGGQKMGDLDEEFGPATFRESAVVESRRGLVIRGREKLVAHDARRGGYAFEPGRLGPRGRQSRRRHRSYERIAPLGHL